MHPFYYNYHVFFNRLAKSHCCLRPYSHMFFPLHLSMGVWADFISCCEQCSNKYGCERGVHFCTSASPHMFWPPCWIDSAVDITCSQGTSVFSGCTAGEGRHELWRLVFAPVHSGSDCHTPVCLPGGRHVSYHPSQTYFSHEPLCPEKPPVTCVSWIVSVLFL